MERYSDHTKVAQQLAVEARIASSCVTIARRGKFTADERTDIERRLFKIRRDHDRVLAILAIVREPLSEQ
ncbi:hypothetical protein [Paracoccus sp. R12_2]|uniref:hypothetical protein n=1 Tax=Paracoccus sp. R12_2 TaxID=2821098 RepID=UPI001ADBD538|nr:hypothetical protein [Paracoccus sp. R12_2]